MPDRKVTNKTVVYENQEVNPYQKHVNIVLGEIYSDKKEQKMPLNLKKRKLNQVDLNLSTKQSKGISNYENNDNYEQFINSQTSSEPQIIRYEQSK